MLDLILGHPTHPSDLSVPHATDVSTAPMGEATSHVVLVDAAAAAVSVGQSARTVFRWGQRGVIRRVGKDRAGRWLYDLDEVQAYAARPRRVPARLLDTDATGL